MRRSLRLESGCNYGELRQGSDEEIEIMARMFVRTVLGCLEFGRLNTFEQSKEMIDICLRAGCNEFDTSAEVSGSKSETFIAQMESMNDPNLPVTLSVRVHPWDGKALTYNSVIEQMDYSLNNLQRKSIELFYLNAPDHNTPIEETLRAVDKLHKDGKFKEFGLSNYPSWQVAEIFYLCKINGYVLPTIYQGMYNPITRDVERELFPCIRRLGIRFYAYNPLCGGLLTGKHKFDDIHRDPDQQTAGRFFNNGPWNHNYQQRYWKKFVFATVGNLKTTLDRVYGEGQVSPAEASFRWLYNYSKMDGNFDDAVLIGISSKKHLEDNLRKGNRGPLHEDVLRVFDDGWEQMKATCPPYFR